MIFCHTLIGSPKTLKYQANHRFRLDLSLSSHSAHHKPPQLFVSWNLMHRHEWPYLIACTSHFLPKIKVLDLYVVNHSRPPQHVPEIQHCTKGISALYTLETHLIIYPANLKTNIQQLTSISCFFAVGKTELSSCTISFEISNMHLNVLDVYTD